MTTTHALYRFFADSGELLYIGVSLNPAARWQQHRDSRPWWLDVANITIEPHVDRQAVLEAERLAIITEKPLHNITHNKKDPPQQQPLDLIQWRCDICKNPVDDKTGYIQVSYRDMSNYEKAKKQWEMDHPFPPDGLRIINGAELLKMPNRAPWRVLHQKCDPDPEETDPVYWFDIERARTHADLLDWTAHLIGKNWIRSTNWEQIIRKALSGYKVEAT